MPIRKCRQIQKGVVTYNVGRYLVEDLAFRSALVAAQSLPWSLGRLTEVCLVADWGSLPKFSFMDRIAMASEVEACWPVLQWMRTLPVGTSSQPVTSPGLVDVLCRYTRLLPKPGGRGQLSFVSKYLHFCVNDAYPIWDRNARTALAQPRDPPATWVSYKAWLKAIGQEIDDHSSCCLGQLRLPGESLVRTLDKALYIIGQRVLRRREQKKKRA